VGQWVGEYCLPSSGGLVRDVRGRADLSLARLVEGFPPRPSTRRSEPATARTTPWSCLQEQANLLLVAMMPKVYAQRIECPASLSLSSLLPQHRDQPCLAVVVDLDQLPTRTCRRRCRRSSLSTSARSPAAQDTDFAAFALDAQARRRSRRAAAVVPAVPATTAVPGGRGSAGTAARAHECIPTRRRVRGRAILAITPARSAAPPLKADR
jgi:hypothetical protein